MTKEELVVRVAKSCNSTQTETRRFLDCLICVMQDALLNNETVRLAGFGAFEPVFRAARTGHNPHTGEIIPIPGRVVPRFKPSENLIEKMGSL